MSCRRTIRISTLRVFGPDSRRFWEFSRRFETESTMLTVYARYGLPPSVTSKNNCLLYVCAVFSFASFKPKFCAVLFFMFEAIIYFLSFSFRRKILCFWDRANWCETWTRCFPRVLLLFSHLRVGGDTNMTDMGGLQTAQQRYWRLNCTASVYGRNKF